MGDRKKLLKADSTAAITWILFIPFHVDEGGYEMVTWAEDWAQIKNKDLVAYPNARYKVLYYTGEVRPAISNLGPNDVVYVLGHSGAGLDFISVHEDSGTKLTYDMVCTRLVQSGLREKFAGAVKFYHCYGGSKGSGTMSIAERCAALLAVWGYRLCKVYGYKGKVCAKKDADPKAVTANGHVVGKASDVQWDFTAGGSEAVLVEKYKAVVAHPKPVVNQPGRSKRCPGCTIV